MWNCCGRGQLTVGVSISHAFHGFSRVYVAHGSCTAYMHRVMQEPTNQCTDVVSNANASRLVLHIKYTGGIDVAAEVATITCGTAEPIQAWNYCACVCSQN